MSSTELEKEIVVRSNDLRDQVKGSVYVRGDEGYDAAKQGWNLAVVQRPLVVVDATCEEDVQAAVRFANEAGLGIGVITTGHSLPRTCDGGLLIRLSAMNRATVDPEARTARVQGGAQFKHLFPETQTHGLAPLSGSAPHVGVVGYMIGGGYGLLLRKYGLGVDSLRSARIVTGSGDLLTASPDENPDLFWAIRGGGGAFGVITEVELALYPEATVFGGATIYPAEEIEEKLNAYVRWAKTLPNEVTSCFQIMNLPPAPFIPEPLRGKSVVNINACVCGDLEAAEELVRPIRELGPSIVDRFGTFPFSESAAVFNDPVDPLPASGQGSLLHDLNPEAIAKLAAAIGPVGACPHVSIQIRHLDGAPSEVGHDETPIGSRRVAKFLIYMVGVCNPRTPQEALRASSEAILTALEDHTVCRGPLNFLGEGDVAVESIRGVFDKHHLARLQEIKQRHDPQNRFRFAGIGIS